MCRADDGYFAARKNVAALEESSEGTVLRGQPFLEIEEPLPHEKRGAVSQLGAGLSVVGALTIDQALCVESALNLRGESCGMCSRRTFSSAPGSVARRCLPCTSSSRS